MNEKAYPQVPTQSPIQRKEPIVKTTLRTVLTALTLFALLTTAFANGDPDPLEGLVFNVAGNYYDGYITAAWLAVTGSSASDHPPGTTGFVLAIAETYYGGDVEAAITALTEAFASEEMREQIIDVLTSR